MAAYYALFLKSEFGLVRACPVQADDYEEKGSSTHFYRRGRLVFQAPTAIIHRVEPFDNQLEMQERIRKHRERFAGAATFHVHEKGCAPRGGRKARSKGLKAPSAGFVEQVSISITEPVPAHARKRR